MAETVKQIDDGGLAFPGVRNQQVGNVSDYGFTDDDSPTFADVQHPGMSLRDWFAGQVLCGFMSAKAMHFNPDDDAAYCYKVADAMIAHRKAGAA
jgi:hypothetical protein